MKDYKTSNIRNVAVVGHGSDGKTTLVEALLYYAGAIDRQGRVEDGSTTAASSFAQAPFLPPHGPVPFALKEAKPLEGGALWLRYGIA